MPKVPLLQHCLSLLACTRGFMGSVLQSVGKGRGGLGPGLQMFLCDMKAPPKSGQLEPYKHSWNIPEGQWGREILPAGRTLGSTSDCGLLLRRKDDQMCSCILVHEL